MALRSRRKDARPGEIVAAALASFAERGYAATKLEDVAAAAGISKGTIYLYFPTKEDLFRAVVRQAVLPNLEAAEAQFAAHAGSCADLLRVLAQRFLRLLDSDLTAVPKLVVAESGNFPAIAQFYADTVLRRAFPWSRASSPAACSAASSARWTCTPPCRCSSRPFLLLALWKHSLGRHTDLTFDPRAVADAHLDVLLRGLAAEHATMKRALLAVVLVAAAPARPAGGGCSRATGPAAWQGYVDAEYVRVSPTLTGRITGIAVARGDSGGGRRAAVHPGRCG